MTNDIVHCYEMIYFGMVFNGKDKSSKVFIVDFLNIFLFSCVRVFFFFLFFFCFFKWGGGGLTGRNMHQTCINIQL